MADYPFGKAPVDGAPRVHGLSSHPAWQCHVFYAHEVGLGIDLQAAELLLRDAAARGALRDSRRIPHLNFRQPPLRLALDAAPVAFDGFSSSGTVFVTLYEFGAASVRYTLGCPDLDRLLALSISLERREQLKDDSRRRVEELLDAIKAAVNRPRLAPVPEDYFVFRPAAEDGAAAVPPGELLARSRHRLAQLLRAETATLSEEEVDDALSARIAYRDDDLAIIDWNSAVVVGREVEDVLAVLEYANVSLLELRWLDDQLDRLIDQSYDKLMHRGPGSRFRRGFPLMPDREARRVAEYQIDGTLLFEAVSNALKLIGDPFLARLYRLAAQRLHLGEWDDSIRRKLQVLDSIYEKMADRASTRRLEVLEWIIILLIALSIIPMFT